MNFENFGTGWWKPWILLALLVASPLWAAAQPKISGFLQLDKRFVTGSDSTYIDNFYNEFRLEASSYIGSQLYLFSSIDTRFYDFPSARTLSDLEDRRHAFPIDLNIWEAYLDVYGFLFDQLDIRVGKQRINWGTADKLNPTDNLNPNDFSDLVDFTDKLPSWAFTGTWYFGDSRLTGVWLPALSPVLLPRNGASLFLGPELSSLSNDLNLPAHTPGNSMFAFKYTGLLGKWDYSISYFNGYDDFPLLSRLNLDAASLRPVSFDMTFPRMQVAGADLAGEFQGIGLWAETALVFPEELKRTTRIGPNTAGSTTALDDKPYLKWTLGGDYTFPGGWYLNAQWMHGFDIDRGAGKLHDYLFARVEQSFWGEDIKIEAGAALEVSEWNNPGDHYGYGLFPALTYQAIDNLEVKAGAFLIYGKPSTLFGNWQNLDQVFVRFRVDF